jgi:hypothetical protein
LAEKRAMPTKVRGRRDICKRPFCKSRIHILTLVENRSSIFAVSNAVSLPLFCIETKRVRSQGHDFFFPAVHVC